jgi:enoyl-CoA hydratase/isomerase-like protein
MATPDLITGFFDLERYSPLTGDAWVVLDCSDDTALGAMPDGVVIGVDRMGAMPKVEADRFDILLTAADNAPAPWVSCSDPDKAVRSLSRAIAANPIAATVLVEVLRLQEGLPFRAGLTLESLAYSTLLRSGEFEQWLKSTDREQADPARNPVSAERDGSLVSLRLDDSANRNAISAPMRDALYEALVNVLEDPSRPDVEITGAGKCFSVGGHLPEFGTAQDAAKAHRIRCQRSPSRLLHLLGHRADVVFHGACIGSGVEIFAAAGRCRARRDAWFQLPELSMGLIPGAGGTVTVSRAIGRHRAAWFMLSGKRIDAGLAKEWGLIEDIVE